MALKSIRKYTEEWWKMMHVSENKSQKNAFYVNLSSNCIWICHIPNFSMFVTTQDVLHLCGCAADVTSCLLPYIWCKSSEKLKCETDRWTLSSATLFTGKKIQSGVSIRLKNTEMKHLIFHVVVFLRFFVSPFDLICSFGLVGAQQLIQQTWLRRCEACTQI